MNNMINTNKDTRTLEEKLLNLRDDFELCLEEINIKRR
jgi:hypothetical protein